MALSTIFFAFAMRLLSENLYELQNKRSKDSRKFDTCKDDIKNKSNSKKRLKHRGQHPSLSS